MSDEPLICSQGGIPYNKAHLDARDATIGELRAEIERLRADNKLLQEDLARCRAFYEAWMTARRALEGK